MRAWKRAARRRRRDGDSARFPLKRLYVATDRVTDGGTASEQTGLERAAGDGSAAKGPLLARGVVLPPEIRRARPGEKLEERPAGTPGARVRESLEETPEVSSA